MCNVLIDAMRYMHSTVSEISALILINTFNYGTTCRVVSCPEKGILLEIGHIKLLHQHCGTRYIKMWVAATTLDFRLES